MNVRKLRHKHSLSRGLCMTLRRTLSSTKFVFRRIRSSPSASVEPDVSRSKKFPVYETGRSDCRLWIDGSTFASPSPPPPPPSPRSPSLPKRLCGSCEVSTPPICYSGERSAQRAKNTALRYAVIHFLGCKYFYGRRLGERKKLDYIFQLFEKRTAQNLRGK